MRRRARWPPEPTARTRRPLHRTDNGKLATNAPRAELRTRTWAGPELTLTISCAPNPVPRTSSGTRLTSHSSGWRAATASDPAISVERKAVSATAVISASTRFTPQLWRSYQAKCGIDTDSRARGMIRRLDQRRRVGASLRSARVLVRLEDSAKQRPSAGPVQRDTTIRRRSDPPEVTRAQHALRRLIDGYHEQLITHEELRAPHARTSSP